MMNITKLHTILLFAFFIQAPFLNGQILMSGDLEMEVHTIIDNLPDPDNDDYSNPSATQSNDWEIMLNNLTIKNYGLAASQADALGYDLVEFTDIGSAEIYYCLWTKSSAANYWGTYIFHSNPCHSNIVIQSPHPRKDLNTGKEGFYVFKTMQAAVYMLSGTNRCNSTVDSSCSGTTSVCSGTSTAYRISDMAHSDHSIFQLTTTYLFDNLPELYFVQFHGFSMQATDPYLIMSNGIKLTPQNIDYLTILRDELLIIDPTLTFKIGHLDTSWFRLLGTTNTQGRYMNISPDPCSNTGTINSGRFLHLEQEYTKFRQNQAAWDKMAIALDLTFQDWTLASDPVNSQTYRTQRTLTANTTLAPTSMVQLSAADTVCLDTSFCMPLGSTLEVTMEGCN